jgi:anti-anti-sigma regulatory factor
MRAHGLAAGVSGLDLRDHVCWVSDADDDWLAAAIDFLADGQRLGQRLVYVGPQPADELARRLTPLGDVDALVRDGVLSLHPVDQLYDLSEILVPEQQLATYVAVNDQACAEGYQGLRVLADVTALIEDPRRRAEHARWELLADCYMATRPFTAMCVYDRRVVGDDAVADIACVHPLVHGSEDLVPFTLFGTDDGVALWGDVDVFSTPAFARSLSRVPERDGDLVLDLSRAGYVGHQAVAALVEHSQAMSDRRRLLLRDASPGFRKVCDVLDFDTENVEFVAS